MVKVWLFCHLRCVIITANWEYTVFLSSSVKELRIFHIDGATYLCSDTRANWRHLNEWLSFGHLQTIYTYTSLYPWCQYSALLSPHSSWQIPNVGLICGITRCWHDAYRNSGITETDITWRFRNRFTLTLSDAVKNGRPSSGRSVDKSYKYRDESILRIIALWLRVAKIKNQFTVHFLGL